MSDPTSPTDDTLVADHSPTHVEGGKIGGKQVRSSQPSLDQPDYAELPVVDRRHYAFGRELARGGMGRISVARDRRLGREVALKEVADESGTLALRFEREARITARLQHPSIVSVHEAGMWPSGDPFYAMRLVSGRSLDEAIEKAKTFEGRLALLPNVLAVADAMAYAHGQRVIHRDLKPKNIVVGEFGETVVIDWGLAKELGAPDDSGASAADRTAKSSPAAERGSGPIETSDGEVLGTPGYMPPEQAEGKPVDERADVYAIGAMLYHVLAGGPPYTATRAAAVLVAVQEGPPPPIRERAPDTPDELVAIVERSMARDPAQRYPSARELAEDLRRFQTGQLVGAHRYSLRQLLARWMRRHRTALVALAAALVVGSVVGLLALRRIVDANHEIARERTLAVHNQKRAEALTSFMLVDLRNKLRAVGRLDVLDAVAKRVTSYYDERGDTGSDEDRLLSGTARMELAGVLDDRSDLRAARAQYERSEALLAPLSAAHPDAVAYATALAHVRYGLAELLSEGGDLPGALARARAALGDADAVYASHPGDAKAAEAVCFGNVIIGDTLAYQGDADGAIGAYQRAIKVAKTADAGADEQVQKQLLVAEAGLGWVLRHAKHDLPGALAHYRAALAIAEANAARDPSGVRWGPDVAASHDEVAAVLADQGDRTGQMVELRAGLEVAERLVATDPTNQGWKEKLASSHDRIGSALLEAHDLAGARAEYEAEHELVSQLVAAAPSLVSLRRTESIADNKLGDVELAAGKLDAAVTWYRAGLALREELVAKDPTNMQWLRDLFYSHYELANAVLAQGHQPAAISELRVALRIAEQLAAAHPGDQDRAMDVAGIHEGIADVLATMHDVAGARAEYAIAIGMARPQIADPQWKTFADKLAKKVAALR